MTEQAPREPHIPCAACQSPLPAQADDRLLHCPACQAFNRLMEDDTPAALDHVLMQPAQLNRPQVEKVARKWMAEGFWKAADLAEEAHLVKVEGIAVPFWALELTSRTYWSGMNKRSRVVGSGEQRRNQTYWEPVSGDFSSDHHWTFYARQDPAEIMGLGAVSQGGSAIQADWGRYLLGFQAGGKTEEARNLRKGALPFAAEQIPDMQIVPGQLDRSAAEAQAQRSLEGQCRGKAHKFADRVIECDTALDIQEVNLVYLPIWQIEYVYKGRMYHMLLSGGDGAIISAEHPVGKWDKVVLTGMILGVIGAGGGVAAWLTETPSLWIIPYACIGLLALHASWTALFSKG